MRTSLPQHLREKLVEFGQKVLWSDEGADHLKYILSERGIDETQARKLGLGYIPSRLRSYFWDQDVFDLSGRILMPIRDAYGRLIAVSSRDTSPEASLKHFNESFVKAHHLYGIDAAKEAIQKRGAAIIVEGQFDVGNLWTKGLTHTVAVLGSALSPIQASILSRYCSTIYLLMDGDKAGREATIKSMEMANARHFRHMGVSFIPVLTPWGKDPDDLTAAEVRKSCMDARHAYNHDEGEYLNGFFVHAT